MSAMELYQALKANNHSLIDQIKLSNTAELNKCSQKNSDGIYILYKLSGGADGFMDVAASNSLARLYADKLINEKTCSMVPVRTPQDGNCLFSAVSIALIGNNMLASTLRKLCAIELYKNANFFAVHPVFRLGHLSGVFRSERSAFLLGISNVACTTFEAKKSKVDAILAEALNISQSGVWSSLVCVMSISNVLKIPLKLFYPTTGDVCLEYLFRSTLYPQTFKKCDEPYQIIYLLLYNVESKKEIPDNLTHMGKMHYFKPNHFVPLVSIISTQPEFRNILVRTQTSLNSSKNIVVTGEKRPSNNSLLQIPCSAVQKINLTKPSLSIKNFFSVNNKPLPVYSSSSVLSNKFEKPISGVVIPKLNVNCENATTEDDCNEFDIGLFVDKVGKLSNQEKRNILLNVWIPPSDYVFPKTNGRKCNPAWFKKFSWLCYSKYYDGLFCISCVLFGKASSTSQLFHEYPFRFWSVGNVRIISHNNTSPMHKTSIQIMLDFQAVISKKTVPINLQLNKFLSDNISRNRQILFSISRAILFCCRQNISLRGHRDDAKHLALQCNNAGNFQCLLDLMALCGDKILSDHFKNGPKNATYRSKTVQNELIDICAGVVRSLLTNRIKKAKFFSILADEASDVSQTEQMAVVVRYVDECCKVKEDFLKFVSCNSGLTGVLLSTKIKKSIHKLGLEMSYCRGQGYDGAGNMAGRLCGVAALILKDFPKAPYIHCYSHQLNLCVAKACAIPTIRDMMDHVRIVSDFFNNSPKRLEDLSTKIVELCPTSSFQKTINVCRTRWIERIDGLEAFIELYPAIIASLTCIKEDETWNYKSRGDASAYVTICCSFKFIITLIIVRKLLGYTRPLTKTLQKVDQDFSKARDDVEILKNTLLSIRSSIEISHSEWYKEAVTIAATNYTLPSKPRTCGQQTQRDNHQVDDISEYYRVTCSIPFLDHILTQLDSLFSLENLTLLDSFAIIPSNLISDKKWRKKVKEFAHTYNNDLPEPSYLYAELDMWEVYWKNHSETAPKTISDSLQKCDGNTFPNISTILRILCTVPVTTCTCERSLSALKRIKTSLRNSMTDDRLNGISMLHIHRDVEIDLNIVVDEFATAFPRRMEFKNILNSDE